MEKEQKMSKWYLKTIIVPCVMLRRKFLEMR